MTDLTIVSGGLRMPSSTRLLADRLAVSATNHLAEQGFSVTTRVVELRPLARSIADAMTTGFANTELEEAFETVADFVRPSVVQISVERKAGVNPLGRGGRMPRGALYARRQARAPLPGCT